MRSLDTQLAILDSLRSLTAELLLIDVIRLALSFSRCHGGVSFISIGSPQCRRSLGDSQQQRQL